jgi:16S rRNA (cytosine967-C5)-methyltransferase
MRGIEGALKVLNEVERGAFASEALRRLPDDIGPKERKLASTLVYLTLRRLGLWKHILGKYCRRPVKSMRSDTVLSLVAGIAGVLELKHFGQGALVSALVERVRRADGGASAGDSALVNAVLHAVIEKAPGYIEELRASTALRDLALGLGVPGWAASRWSRELGMKEAKRILHLSTSQTYMSIRVSPGVDRDEWAREYSASSARPSEVIPSSVRLESNPYPPELPGYSEGLVTPQTESSMWAAMNMMEYWRGGRLLDMCMGRGVKAGHLLTYCPGAEIEGWDLSEPRLRAASKEFGRLGVSGRVRIRCGDAASLSPESPPSAILLDAPCSGSGTWGRRPEGKWRTDPAFVERVSELQRTLLSRACDILSPGGVIMYCTCSMFRDENENVVGAVMGSRRDMVELPARAAVPCSRRGKPYGTIVTPESPWCDGFYAAIFRKKG